MLSRYLIVMCVAVGLTFGMLPTAAAAPVWVTINSSPPGASVYVDGKEQGAKGIASESFRVRLSPGAHRVLLELAGYRPLEQTIQIGTRAQRVAFTLERALARLAVRAPAASDDARDAELFIDAEPKGRVPAELELKEGAHLVEVRKPGFKIYSETVELAPAEVKTLMVMLKPEIRRGTLLITAVGEGQVYVDGQARGTAPQVVELDEGEHGIEVREGAEVRWQQRVKAVAGQQVRVQAEWKLADKTGSLLVIAPAEAEIIIDGTQSARPNQAIAGLRAGQHAILVQAKGYLSATKVVDIEANKQRVEQVPLEKSAAGRGVATVRMVMVNPVDGAEYFINGRRVKEEDLLGDKGLEIAAGKNVVVVQKQGVGKATQTLNVAAGATEVVTMELKNLGRLAVSSAPAGGQILLDGQPVGTTNFTAEDVPPGQHVVEVRLNGYQLFSQPVTVQSGEATNVRADLQQSGGTYPPGTAYPPGTPYPAGEPYPSGAPPSMLRSAMSASLSAVTNDPGRFTVDLGAGYPYFLNLGIAVGAVRIGMFGLDAGVELRSDLYVTEIGAKLRTQLFQAGPIAGGLNLLIAGGGGPDQRNDFVLELGAPITLIAGRFVQITARPYLQVYSDRVCPPADTASQDSLTRGQACTDALNAVASGGQDRAGSLDRYNGARFMLQGALEAYLTRHLNLWLLVEGAPGTQRQAWTRQYNLLLLQEVDYGIYGRAGVTFKF